MNTYIISYDLSQPGQNYENVLKAIKQHGGWARLGGSAYLILSDKTPVEVRDSISPSIDANDKLFVSKITAPAAWAGYTDEISDWIKNNLK